MRWFLRDLIMMKKRRRLYVLFDRLDFISILLIWVGVIVFFGLIYYLISSDIAFLKHSDTKGAVNLFDSIYFSFITGTSTGFGDIHPEGLSKFIALVEVIVGLTLFAMVTSKLVSIKQDAILSEIYDISYNEKINRIRSSLYLFRIDIGKIVLKIEEGAIKKREFTDMWGNFLFFQGTLTDIEYLFAKKGRSLFAKKVDMLNIEIVLNSINQSIDRINELFASIKSHKPELKKEINTGVVLSIMEKIEKLYEKILMKYPQETRAVVELMKEFEAKRKIISGM